MRLMLEIVKESAARAFESCRNQASTIPFPLSLPIQRPGVVTRVIQGATAPHHDCRRFFCASKRELWQLCVGRLWTCRFP